MEKEVRYATPNGSIMLMAKWTHQSLLLLTSLKSERDVCKQSHNHSNEVKDGRITNNPILFRSEEEAENYIPIYEVHRQGIG
jgi:hypothetical protein